MGGIIKDKCKVGYLTVLEIEDNKYKCECICGNQLYASKNKLHNRLIKDCGCMSDDNVVFPDKNFIGYITKFKKRRTNDGGYFDDKVTPKFLWNLYALKQDGVCSLTNLPISFDGTYKPSIDRIDSKKGYIPENIQWVYSKINLMKYNLSNKRFIELCKMVYLNNRNCDAKI